MSNSLKSDTVKLANSVIYTAFTRRQQKGESADGKRGYIWFCKRCFTYAKDDSWLSVDHDRDCPVRVALKHADEPPWEASWPLEGRARST